MSDRLPDVYSEVRSPYTWPGARPYQVKASRALQIAREEMALRAAESAGFVTFDWSWDDLYDPCDLDTERRKLESGEWEALQCVAKGPSTFCVAHRHVVDDCETSLHGIVVDADDEYKGMKSSRREIERELAAELGLI